ncbi:hypothetical protein [Glycomyces buryatensis]|uniref:Uncharacterized protein n=1 Tax=Glycomyces buryatensis TaxID=2570927 RepID=A0A4S8QFJ8_9ACTN|nr:hypothetical protein [Glycomyces buryatensis]THV41912.1 hypothetical protein FAB82_09345 [Glycomyces buryatensis]
MLVFVESAQLRSAAQKMKQYSSDAKNLPDKMVRDAREADRSNRGFKCADGAEELAESFETLLSHFSNYLGDVSTLVGDIADNWDMADEECANDFKTWAWELRRFRVPTIPAWRSVGN